MSYFLLSLVLNTSPAKADMGPGICGGGSEDYLFIDSGDCDSADTAEECQDAQSDDQARRVKSRGVPGPVVGSLVASALILGISARRRFR